MATAFVIAAILLLGAFKLGSNVLTIVLYFVALGLTISFIPTTIYTLAPETVPDPRLAGVALATLALGQNGGMLLGPPVIGRAVAGGSWADGTYPMVIGSIVALIAALLVRTRAKGE
ncbi:hypothetical protein TAMC210_18000 [Thermanaeromonas sp. C210]|nr:hypothetical protein TAMC210_18000 [Thermanaeromonas sp. C210]